MPKVTAEEITALGFKPDMFRKTTEDDLLDFIEDIIDEVSPVFKGRIGISIYDSTSEPTKYFVKRAELCLVAGELVQRRINIILGNVVGAGNEIDISHEGAQKKAYLDEAERWIGKLTSDDFASGVLETSHFESAAISGEEHA